MYPQVGNPCCRVWQIKRVSGFLIVVNFFGSNDQMFLGFIQAMNTHLRKSKCLNNVK